MTEKALRERFGITLTEDQQGAYWAAFDTGQSVRGCLRAAGIEPPPWTPPEKPQIDTVTALLAELKAHLGADTKLQRILADLREAACKYDSSFQPDGHAADVVSQVCYEVADLDAAISRAHAACEGKGRI